MVFNRQRGEAQTEAERSAASTEQSAPRSGIKITRLVGIAAKPGKVIMMTWVKLTYSYLITGVSVHQAYKCEKHCGDVLPTVCADD
ncbi:hypothetical protein EH207_11110 [Brenneria rubrifaciens]|uniref:Uncharacterized protein n=1 Tax=Brenneria rubrifaciens TaxID=55213 RepID=A0A4P8QU90_9GAMM|nr:hypothetical protein EH207_11110 [Brenneria rubrifaciens]